MTIEEFYQRYGHALSLRKIVDAGRGAIALEACEQVCFLERLTVPLELAPEVRCVIVPPSCLQDYLITLCQSQGLALFETSLNKDTLFRILADCLAGSYQTRVACHGTLVQVWDQGVLIRGESGSGKSDLALGLVDRHHQLVSDDQVEFEVRDGHLFGCCPSGFRGFIEIRGLGIVNLIDLYGEGAILEEVSLDLVVTLGCENLSEEDRISGLHGEWQLNGVSVPEVLLPYCSQRDVPLLVETAARVNRLRQRGDDPYAGFRKALALVMGQEEA